MKTKNPPRSTNPLESITQDIGRELTDTAKQTGVEFVKAFSPSEFLKGIYGTSEQKTTPERDGGGDNHTPLDVEKLQKTHQSKTSDEAEIARLRSEYFARVNEEVSTARQDKDHDEQVRARDEDEDTKRLQHVAAIAQQSQQMDAPVGRIRKNILGGKAVKRGGMNIAPQQQFETKSNKGK
jgi:hypothetical protein